MRRTFVVDVLASKKCSGRMEIIALIDQPPLIKKILDHLGLPTEIPQTRPARPPPLDGTETGTILVKDIPPDNPTGSNGPRNLTAVGGALFFSANDGVHGRELWFSTDL